MCSYLYCVHHQNEFTQTNQYVNYLKLHEINLTSNWFDVRIIWAMTPQGHISWFYTKIVWYHSYEFLRNNLMLFGKNFQKLDYFSGFRLIWAISEKWPIHPFGDKRPKKNSWHSCEHLSIHNYVNCWYFPTTLPQMKWMGQVFIHIKHTHINLSVEYKELLQRNKYKKVNEPHHRNLYKIK